MYYIIYRGYNYYPNAGIDNIEEGTFKSIEECKRVLNSNKWWDWYQIVLVTIDGLQVVESYHC